MSFADCLLSFGLRQLLDIPTESASTWLHDRLTAHGHALPKALARAHQRAWYAVGLALGGESLWNWFANVLADRDLKDVRDQVKQLLARMPSGLEATPEQVRKRCLHEWNTLRAAGRFDIRQIDPELAVKLHGSSRLATPAALARQAHATVDEVAAALASEAPNLAAVLTRTPSPGAAPLLAAAFAFFLRREIETNAELARGLTYDHLRTLSEQQEAGLAGLADRAERVTDLLTRGLAGLGDRLDRIEQNQQETQATLEQILAEVRALHARQPPQDDAGPIEPAPEKPQVTASLRTLLDRLRDLPVEAVPAEHWSLLGDCLAAVNLPDLASECHAQAARAAQRSRDRAAEAEAHFKTYRDACEAGEWERALLAIRRAWELAPQRYRPFDLERYEPRAILGAGGFGVAFHCHDVHWGVDVVVKSLWASDLNLSLDRLFREARLLRQVNHERIIGVENCDFGLPGKRWPYLVMAYFPGSETLESRLRRGVLPPAEALIVAEQMAEGLQAAHAKGIHHLDVKPGNVLVRPSGTTWESKLIDFGLAMKAEVRARTQRTSQPRTQREKSFAATLPYAPPEQKGERSVDVIDHRADLYAWGRTLYHALLGSPAPSKAQRQSLKQPLQQILADCCEDAPDDRPSSFQEVLARLRGTAMATPVPVAVTNPQPQPQPQPVRSQEPKPAAVPVVTGNEPPRNPEPGQEFVLKVQIPEFGKPLDEMILTIPASSFGKPLQEMVLRWPPVAERKP